MPRFCFEQSAAPTHTPASSVRAAEAATPARTSSAIAVQPKAKATSEYMYAVKAGHATNLRASRQTPKAAARRRSSS